MLRAIAPLALLLLATAPAMADDDETLGTLTFDGPGAAEKHVVTIQSMFFQIPPRAGQPAAKPADGPPDIDLDQAHTITVTAQVGAPDPAVLTWMIGPDAKRHATLAINDRPDGATGHSTYELDNAQATGFQLGFGGRGRGNMTLTVQAEHLKINGQVIY